MVNGRGRELARPEINLCLVNPVQESIPRFRIVGVDQGDVEPGQFLFLGRRLMQRLRAVVLQSLCLQAPTHVFEDLKRSLIPVLIR